MARRRPPGARNGMPAPFSSISQVANVNYALTPCSRDAGALVVYFNRQHNPRGLYD